MSKPDDIPADVWGVASKAIRESWRAGDATEILARAILAERERWKPACTYFEHYCQDEADSVENCVCGEVQHEHAKAFAAAIRGGSNV